MRVVLPPSETKAVGGAGAPLDVESLAFPELSSLRLELVTELASLSANAAQAVKALKLGPRGEALLQANLELTTSPTTPAITRYTGVVYDALDPDRAATVSPVVIDHLRGPLGFDGLLMTDDICMNALGGPIAARAAAALAAGCDVVLHCSGDLAEMVQVATQTPRLAGRAADRALRALAARRQPLPVDMAALAVEREALRQPDSA
jgi:hypothetical protein